jgi:hypothetical protein
MRTTTRWAPALLVTLAGCAVSPAGGPPSDRPEREGTISSSPAPVSSSASATAHRAGVGVVQSASVVSLPSSGTAAGGATAGPTMAYRIDMPDGTTQSVVQAGERFQVGDRVQVTSDGRALRPALRP